MALPPSTANWHWKNKNITRWGTEWFQRELPTISITGDSEGEVVSVSKVTDVEGDIELGQRKSKWVYFYVVQVWFFVFFPFIVVQTNFICSSFVIYKSHLVILEFIAYLLLHEYAGWSQSSIVKSFCSGLGQAAMGRKWKARWPFQRSLMKLSVINCLNSKYV